MQSETKVQWYRYTSSRLGLMLAFMLLLLLAEAGGLGQVAKAQSGTLRFILQAMLPQADETNALAIGDLNGDGALDLVVGNMGLTYLYLNDGAGNYGTATPVGVTGQAVDVVVGDVNDDGALDLLVYTLQTPSQVYLNDGAGNFRLHTTFPAAAGRLDQLGLGDLDGDRDLDLIASRESGNSTVYWNNGQGAFTQAATLPAGLNPLLIDQDGDGDLDLIMIQPNSNQPNQSRLYLYRNNGAGTLQSVALTFGGSKGFENQFAVGDIDGDGDLDYVISSYTKAGCSGANCEDLRLLLNRGLLGFGSVRLDTAAVSDLVLVDIDHDGDLDIVGSGFAWNTQSATDRQSKVYLNQGTNELLLSASFVSQELGAADNTARALAVADLNADGLLDIVLGNVGPNALYHQQNQLFANCQLDLLLLNPHSVADINGDGYLDIIQRSGIMRLNDGKGNFGIQLALPITLDSAAQIVAADFNGDGRLDLLTGHPTLPATLYLQTNYGQFVFGTQLDAQSAGATTLATGDFNGDGLLDLVIGRGTQPGRTISTPAPNQLYFNTGAGQFAAGQPLDLLADDTQAIAAGDLDADGDLDLVVANSQETQGQELGKQNMLYFNDGNGGFSEKRPLGNGTDRTRALALGDLNGDGHIDIVTGNMGQLNAIYTNDGRGNFGPGQPVGSLADNTVNVLLVDLDNDRDLDLIAANERQADAVYRNDGLGRFMGIAAFNEPFLDARLLTLAAGDLDRDGDVDLLAMPQQLSLLPYLSGCVMKGRLTKPLRTAARLPQVVVRQPGLTIGAGPYASAAIFAQRTIPIPFTLYDPEGKPVDLRAYYSPDGGGRWLPALPTADTPTRQLATLQGGAAAQHLFQWDVYASNLWGQSDDVLMRLEVQPSVQPRRHRQPEPYQYPYAAAQSYPFRVRGTQVRVVNESGQPMAGALLYRLPVGATGKAELFPVPTAATLRTNANGYFPGRGALTLGDQLVALAPISATHAFTLYHSSATPNALGVDAYTVQAAGVQTLTVSAARPLVLFNLALALEWDARNDGTFLADLSNAIQNSSAILFDVTEGQAALGEVTLYQAKEQWNQADVVIYAANNQQPRASMGGVVITPTHDIGLTGLITDAYLPGQVRMGPLWDPFGQSEAELRQDWWLAFAHELAHYLFFLPDNYLGIEDGLLVKIDCQGSFMTNTYEEPYREFLTRDRWDAQPDCHDKSMAAHTTGRTDWETIQRFLPWLHAPSSAANVNPGPATLPLAVTQLRWIAPTGQPLAQALPARNFDLRNANTGEVIQARQAEVYLFKRQGTAQLEDDTVIALGDTGIGSDRIKVRGATPGDRLCILAVNQSPTQIGCETITATSTSLRLAAVPGWQPDIMVSPVSSRTLAITVTQPLSPGVALQAQLLPATTPTTTTLLRAPWIGLQPDNPTQPQRFTGVITLDTPVFEGFIRVWVADEGPAREAMSAFFLSTGWGPNNRRGFGADPQVWGPNNRRGFGPNNRRGFGATSRFLGAPFASSDGKVTIFEMENIVGYSGEASLQALPHLPNLPLWLTPVGSGYRFLAAEPMARTIAFQYLDRETPKGYEQTLTIYYLPADATAGDRAAWQRLPTYLDVDENLAAARMPENHRQGQGTYALLATVEMPTLTPGWNFLAYVVPTNRPVATALASLAGAYTSVYAYTPAAPLPWRLYDATVSQAQPHLASFVNDLTTLDYGHAYWLYATQSITPYLAVALPPSGTTINAAAAETTGELPPTTFYGPIDGAGILIPSLGMPVTAAINGILCGTGEVAQVGEQWVYKIQVKAAIANNGCGAIGAPVLLGIGGQAVAEIATWDHRQAQYQPVTVVDAPWLAPGPVTIPALLPAPHSLYLPLVNR
ncbi:MAG: VCBS repeat-containing protein [Caldilineaceae bacterium]|nr:VCBS repeat-containing protein [Caldilineaceae bacterium]